MQALFLVPTILGRIAGIRTAENFAADFLEQKYLLPYRCDASHDLCDFKIKGWERVLVKQKAALRRPQRLFGRDF